MDNIDVQVQILLDADAAPFEYVISHLLSSHNEYRVQAERFFNACKEKNPEMLLLKLVHILKHGSDDGLRSMAAVLLHRNFILWPRLNNATQGKVKDVLLSCLTSEAVRSVWKVVCGAVAELASFYYEDGWPQLVSFLIQSSKSEDYTVKEKSLFVIGQLNDNVFRDSHAQLQIHDVFCQCLSFSMPNEVHLAALYAFANFIVSVGTNKRNSFQDLLPMMAQTLISSFEARNETAAREKLEALIEIVARAPWYVREQFHELFNLMIGIIEAKGLEVETRHLALEFVLTLSEARSYALGMMKKRTQLISRLFIFLLNLLEDVEDNGSWLVGCINDVNDGLSNNFILGKEALERLSVSLGGKVIFPIMHEKFIVYMDNSDWKKRHAALIALSHTSEGCHKVMIKELESFIHMVLVSFGDPHVRVRWAAINAIGQLYSDFGQELPEQFHQKIAPALIDAVGDFQNAPIQAQAAAAVVSFCEVCTAEDLKPWLYKLTEKLLVLLQNGKCAQREIALTALGAVAESAQSVFKVCYDHAMPYLKHIYDAMDKNDISLCAKTIDCISMIGLAVGKDKFIQDAKEVLHQLLFLMTSISDFDDPTACLLIQTSSRICKCLVEDFLPYMDALMPALLNFIQPNHGVSMTEETEMVEQNRRPPRDRETIIIGNKRYAINMSSLECIAIACDVLSCYLDELKELFHPWLEKVLPAVASLLSFPFHAMVRMVAASAMPRLLYVAKSAVDKGLAQGHSATYLKQISNYVISSLVEVLRKELTTDVFIETLGALDESLQVLGICLEDTWVHEIVDGLMHVLIKRMIKAKERQERKASMDIDEEELDQLKEEAVEEEAILLQVSNCTGTLAKLQKSAFSSYFNNLVPFIIPALDKNQTSEEKCVAISIFNDVAEHCGTSAVRYYCIFLPFLIEAAFDDDVDVRQAAVYGLGVCAENGNARLELFFQEAMKALNCIIDHESGSQLENRMVTDNAISALGKICEYRSDCINAALAIPAWLCHLPIKNDLREAKILHQLFFSMVERLDPLLLGQKNGNLPKVLSVFAEILIDGADLASEEMLASIPSLLQKLKRVTEPSFSNALTLLPPENQKVLMHIIGNP